MVSINIQIEIRWFHQTLTFPNIPSNICLARLPNYNSQISALFSSRPHHKYRMHQYHHGLAIYITTLPYTSPKTWTESLTTCEQQHSKWHKMLILLLYFRNQVEKKNRISKSVTISNVPFQYYFHVPSHPSARTTISHILNYLNNCPSSTMSYW